MTAIAERQPGKAAAAAPRKGAERKRSYWPFVVPAIVVVSSVIVFPWAFTIWMSLHEWNPGGARLFVGLSNYARLPSDERFVTAVWHTLIYTFLAVLLPLVLGTFAALVFNAKFRFRGVLRGLYVMPMMATPVAIALVWTMMFHPQLGVLNYLLSLVGIGPQCVGIPSGDGHPVARPRRDMAVDAARHADRARRPRGDSRRSPMRAPRSTAPTRSQRFRFITLPMIAPFMMVAVIIRTIDALKSFDVIYAITQGGPGTASETINLYLYSVAFAYYDVGYGSAIAVVFFVLVVALSLLMLHLRQRTKWAEIGRLPYELAQAPRPDRAVVRGDRDRLASGPLLPLDAFPFGQVRGRQRRLSAHPHPRALRVEKLSERVRIEPLRSFLPEQHHRHGHSDVDRAPDRRSGGLRHRPDEGDARGRRRAHRAHDAGPVLSHPPLPALPVAGAHGDARAPDHRPPRHHGADRHLDHDRLFRNDAARTRGGSGDRRGERLAGLPPRCAPDCEAWHHGRPSSSR